MDDHELLTSGIRCVLLSFDGMELVQRAMAAGATGHLLKGVPPDGLAEPLQKDAL